MCIGKISSIHSRWLWKHQWPSDSHATQRKLSLNVFHRFSFWSKICSAWEGTQTPCKKALVHRRHCFAALKILKCADGQHRWNQDVLWVTLLKHRSCMLMSVREIVLHCRPQNDVFGIVLPNRLILKTIATLPLFAKAFGIELNVKFYRAKTKTIDDILIASKFLHVRTTQQNRIQWHRCPGYGTTYFHALILRIILDA